MRQANLVVAGLHERIVAEITADVGGNDFPTNAFSWHKIPVLFGRHLGSRVRRRYR